VIHEPRRTCVACRQVRGKHELVRLVRREEGTVVVDDRGQAPGRGAYVCAGDGCAARLVKGGRLSQAFRRPSKADMALVTAVQARAGSMRVESSVTSSRR
jgi:predicted RNA-binding protein YlxR (DUF448 family)